MFYIWRMKIKWYLSTLVLVFIFFGLFQKQMSAPNQEILVAFNTEEVSIEQSQNAVAAISDQLRAFGIDDILVQKTANGSLKISYHSAISVENIKKTFGRDLLELNISPVHLEKSNRKFPSKNNQKDYNLDVYAIQKTSDNNQSTGKYVIAVKQDFDRYLNTSFYPNFISVDLSLVNQAKSTLNSFSEVSFNLINDTSYIIPEVRAGPNYLGRL